jgi:phosphoglycerate dehydrogenase-like enzyme
VSLLVGVMTSRSGPVLAAELDSVPGLHVTRIASPDELESHIGALDVLIVSNDLYLEKVAKALKGAPRVQWLQVVSSGFDNVLRFGAPPNIAVSRGGPNHAPAVAEHAVMLLLALVRRLPDYERNRIAHRWDRQGLRFRMGSLEGATVMILGFGAIGSEIAKRLRAFGVRILAVKRHVAEGELSLADRMIGMESWRSVLGAVDAVLLSVPLSAETRRLIGRDELAAMKRSAFLVNVSRGGVIDHEALLEALRKGTIAGAGLDVFEEEPLPPTSPLWDEDRLILSPHVAGAGGDEGTKRTIALVKDNIARFLAKEPLLNPVPGYPQEKVRV